MEESPYSRFSLTLEVAGEIWKVAGEDKWAKIFFEPRSGFQNVLGPSRGSEDMLPQKILKM